MQACVGFGLVIRCGPYCMCMSHSMCMCVALHDMMESCHSYPKIKFMVAKYTTGLAKWAESDGVTMLPALTKLFEAGV